MEIFRFTLPNGLRVVHCYDPAAYIATVTTLYNVGARDEARDHTGMAHLFEHLMFGGSANIPDFDGPLQEAGGYSNAYTSADFTLFYDQIPAQNIATALWLESDRMLSLAFSDKALEVQRSVVVEEFKQVCLNRPYGDLAHKFYGLCYPTYPYGVPVIGRSFGEIEQTTQQDVKDWFFSHYAPNNAVLTVVGNVSPDHLHHLVEKWYGNIPRRAIAPRLYADEPLPTAPRLLETSGKVPQTAISIGFPMGAYGSELYAATDLVTDVLANGKASRFYRNLLTPGKLFTDIDASILGTEHPGLLLVNARLLDNSPEAEKAALDAISTELQRLKEDGPTDRELERCKTRVESDRLFSRMQAVQKGQDLAYAEFHDETFEENLARYRAVTPDDLRRAARQVLDPARSSTLIYRPQD